MRMYFEMDPQETKDLIHAILQDSVLEKARAEERAREFQEEKTNKEIRLILDELKTITQHQQELISEVARMKQYRSDKQKNFKNKSQD